MPLADVIAARIAGDRGRVELEPRWDREREFPAPAAGRAWISIARLCVNYEECVDANEPEPGVLDILMEQELELTAQYALKSSKYSHVPGRTSTIVLPVSFSVVKDGKSTAARPRSSNTSMAGRSRRLVSSGTRADKNEQTRRSQ